MAGNKVNEEGLSEFTQSLQRLASEDIDVEKAAVYVYSRARRLIPRLTGAALNSLTLNGNEISGGGSRAPYFPWLDFGGRVGIDNSVSRPYMSKGRYLYGVLAQSQREVMQVAEEGLKDSVKRAGLEVD